MYRGFNVRPDDNNLLWNRDKYFQIGTASYQRMQSEVSITLTEFINDDERLNGSSIQEKWFPQLTTDIFISHSHENYKMAVSLAGWLQETFGLTVFVDSCVWRYASDLLHLIDNKYCLNPNKETYSYEKRNYSTSHVHMMLSSALVEMMNTSECLFFLNTPESLSASDTIEKTESPWIYFELAVSQYLKVNTPSRISNEFTKSLAEGKRLDETPLIEYEVSTRHLKELDILKQIMWGIDYTGQQHALDRLYHLIG